MYGKNIICREPRQSEKENPFSGNLSEFSRFVHLFLTRKIKAGLKIGECDILLLNL
jgi:hypothetical protein